MFFTCQRKDDHHKHPPELYLDDVWMAGETQVVVGAEVQDRLCAALKENLNLRAITTSSYNYSYSLGHLSVLILQTKCFHLM
jgi:hypothetical protein